MDEYHGSGFHCVCNEERCGGQVATLENGTEIGTRWYRSTGKRNGNVRLKLILNLLLLAIFTYNFYLFYESLEKKSEM